MTISFAAAKVLAESSGGPLADEFLESDDCWIFFHTSSQWATAVSRSGSVREVYDLRSEPAKMNDYLFVISAFLRGDEDSARSLLADFKAKFHIGGLA